MKFTTLLNAHRPCNFDSSCLALASASDRAAVPDEEVDEFIEFILMSKHLAKAASKGPRAKLLAGSSGAVSDADLSFLNGIRHRRVISGSVYEFMV